MASFKTIAARGAVLLKTLLFLYLFLLSISIIGGAFKFMGEERVSQLLTQATGNRFLGLFVGVLTTGIVQSSSMVTSLVVSIVAGGVLPLRNAIPIMMGANIGTTVTNIIVSLGHIRRRAEFRRAFAAATVHDIFNILTTAIVFPLELVFGILEKSVVFLTGLMPRAETAFSHGHGPLKPLLKPPLDWLKGVLAGNLPEKTAGIVMASISLLLLFTSLVMLVKVLRKNMIGRLEAFFSRYLFRNPFLSLFLGFLITAVVQSSSVTTSLMVPLAGAGVLTLSQIFPFTLGANMGTTVTALLGSLGGSSITGLQVALSHCLFNAIGIAIFYPLRRIPITLARRFAITASVRKVYAFLMIALVFFVIPIGAILISEFFR